MTVTVRENPYTGLRGLADAASAAPG